MPPTTDDLPLLVVHGAHLWKAILIASVAAACGLGWLVRRLLASGRARAAVRRVERGPREHGESVLHGTLGGTGDADADGDADGDALAATLRADNMHTGQEATSSRRAGALWIETDDGRVLLDGELCVAAGSRAAAARGGVPDEVSEVHLRAARESALWLHRTRSHLRADVRTASLVSVGPGDRVVVRGRLERVAGAEPAGYRDPAAVQVLRPLREDRPIELAAGAPRGPLPRMDRFALVVSIAGLAFLSWGIMKSAGTSSAERCSALEPRTVADEPLEISSGHACAVAAALPGSRDRAMYALARLLDKDPYRDARSVRRLASAIAWEGDCREVTAKLLEHTRLEDAARTARACGDHRTEHQALVAQGLFEDAARVEVPEADQRRPLPDAPTLIAAGRWTDAARLADARAEAERAKPAEGTSTRERYARCLAELLRGFGGDRSAEPRLRALDAEEPGACAPMLAELGPPGERHRLPEAPATTVLGQLRWAAGLEGSRWERSSPEHMLAAPDRVLSRSNAHLAWLAAQAGEPPAELSPSHRASLLRWRAVAQVLDGEIDAARVTAEAAVAALSAGEPSRYPHSARFLPAITSLYTPATELGLDLAREHREDRDGMDLYYARLMLRGVPGYRWPWHDPPYREALAAAWAGDGHPLARYLGAHDRGWEEGEILAILPWIRTGRDAIARQLTFRTPLAYGYASLWQLALHAALRREVLKLAGAAEEAARWGAIYRRFDAAFGDRRRLIALMLWED